MGKILAKKQMERENSVRFIGEIKKMRLKILGSFITKHILSNKIKTYNNY